MGCPEGLGLGWGPLMSITSHISSLNFSPSCHQLLSHFSSSFAQSLSLWSAKLETSLLLAVDCWVSFYWTIMSLMSRFVKCRCKIFFQRF